MAFGKNRGGGLRVVLVVESMESGVAQLIYLLARGLDRLGHEVHLLHPIDRLDTEVIVRLRACSQIRCIPINMKRKIQFGDFRAGIRLRQYLKKNGPFDVVHGHSSKAGALVRLFCLGLPGIRLYTPHAFYTLTPDLPLSSRLFYGAAERLLAFLCSGIICSSELEKQHALSLGISERQLTIITNAIDPPTLSAPASDQFRLPGQPTMVLGFVGRLEYQKGLDVLLRALALAAEHDGGMQLVVIGDGCMEQSYKTLAINLGISGQVRWLGRQPVHRYLASFDVLVMPSRFEGFSLAPLDAMHAELPIICTLVGGVKECVVNGETGIIVAASDPIALASAIVDLARFPERRHSMGIAAKGRAQSFTVEKMVQETERFYLANLARCRLRDLFHRRKRPLDLDAPVVTEHVR